MPSKDHELPLEMVRKQPALVPESNDYELQSEFARRYEVKGEVKALLLVLEGRKVCISKEARKRILECGDREQLEEWVRRAGTVTSVEELFDS